MNFLRCVSSRTLRRKEPVRFEQIASIVEERKTQAVLRLGRPRFWKCLQEGTDKPPINYKPKNDLVKAETTVVLQFGPESHLQTTTACGDWQDLFF